MNLRIFTLCCLAFAGDAAYNEYTSDTPSGSPRKSHLAVAIAYYPSDNEYALVDPYTVQNLQSDVDYHPKYSHVLLCCTRNVHGPSSGVYYDVLAVKEIIKSDQQISNVEICDRQNEPIHVGKDIGYYIIADDNDLDTYNLPKFSNDYLYKKHDPNGKIFPFLRIMRLSFQPTKFSTQYTEHTFGSYKYFDRKGKSCNEFSYNFDKLPKTDHSYFYENSQVEMLAKFNIQFIEHRFIPQQLTPTDDFVDEFSRLVSCTQWNTTPIWNTIADGPIRTIQNHIRRIAKVVPVNALTVTTHAYQILTVPVKEHGRDMNKEVHLGGKLGDIGTAPRIFLKLLHLRLPLARHTESGQETKYVHYYTAIVIHNELNEQTKKLCEIDICQHNDYRITKDQTIRNMFYCCSIEGENFSKIIKPEHPYELLNLILIPFQVDANGEIIASVSIPI